MNRFLRLPEKEAFLSRLCATGEIRFVPKVLLLSQKGCFDLIFWYEEFEDEKSMTTKEAFDLAADNIHRYARVISSNLARIDIKTLEAKSEFGFQN